MRLILALWALQVLWLIWHFAPEGHDLAGRIYRQQVGAAIRQEDPLFQWAVSLKTVIPADATYVFLDDYAAGKEIQVRYFLAPRRHILLSPQVPASFLFYTLRQEKASFLLIRNQGQPLAPEVLAALRSPAFQPLTVSGPGLVFRVDYRLLKGGFYD